MHLLECRRFWVALVFLIFEVKTTYFVTHQTNNNLLIVSSHYDYSNFILSKLSFSLHVLHFMILLNHSIIIFLFSKYKALHYDGDYEMSKDNLFFIGKLSDTETNMTKALYQMCSRNLKHAVQSS